jgi:hypothetical protein
MAKKAPAKPAAKRKPRAKKPVVPAVEPAVDLLSEDAKARVLEALWNNTHPPIPAWLTTGLKSLLLIAVGIAAGIWFAGGIDVSPGPGPIVNDCLSQSHAADRVSQVAVLLELATQPFDGATDDGRKQAGEWFNAQRFRNRADDFGPFTDAVSEAIASNTEAELAKKLEGK